MKFTTLALTVVSIAALVLVGSPRHAAAEPGPAGGASTAPAPATKGNVEHGKYLVQICTCDDCHTPSLKNGEPDMKHRLQGSVLFFKPLAPVPGWVTKSMPVAGLKGWSDAEALRFFTTGVDRKGKHAHPPMPGFRFSQSDALDLIAFLRTLK